MVWFGFYDLRPKQALFLQAHTGLHDMKYDAVKDTSRFTPPKNNQSFHVWRSASYRKYMNIQP